jgi:hypothetical protein
MNKELEIIEFKSLIDAFDKTFPGANAFSLVYDNKPFMNYLSDDGFFTAPASTRYHGSYDGGLYDHSKTVCRRLIDLTIKNSLKWQRPESPFIVGMFHDLCKCDQYIKTESEERPYEYNQNTLLKGHGSKSVAILSNFIDITEEEALCVHYHMGAFEIEDWQGFDQAIKKFETVLWTHHADMLASKVDNT